MPIIKSAVKKMKQDQRRYARNLRTKRALRTAVKTFEAKPSFDSLREVQSKIDTAVKKNILSKAAAGRRMSALSRAAKAAGVKITTLKKTAPAKPATRPTTKSPAKKPAVKKPVTKKSAVKKPITKKTAAKQ